LETGSEVGAGRRDYIGFLVLSSSGGSGLGGRFVAAYQNATM
jgi:hypothetical protein